MKENIDQKRTGMVKVTEGKTKEVYRYKRDSDSESRIVLIVSKPVLTKGNGETIVPLPGKDEWANKTTCNVFELLRRHNIPVAYKGRASNIAFDADEADMVKIEVVYRNLPYGSRLKRNPEEQGIEHYLYPVIEFFLKDDKEGDPFMEYDVISKQWLLFDAGKPLSAGFIRALSYLETNAGRIIDVETIEQMIDMAGKIAKILTEAWKKLGVLLVDVKMEFGFILRNGKYLLVLCDVIDNDSWRIWPDGDESKMKDKQAFRILSKIKPEDLNTIAENYKWVANKTEQFLSM